MSYKSSTCVLTAQRNVQTNAGSPVPVICKSIAASDILCFLSLSVLTAILAGVY